jgi:hypothetical protein
MRSLRCCLAVALVGGTLASAALAPPAAAFNPVKAACAVGGAVDKRVKLLCSAISAGSAALKLAKSLLGGKLFSGLKGLAGLGGGATSAIASRAATAATVAVGLAAIGTWVLGGARFAVHAAAAALNQTTTPQLQSTWFSSTYWRVAGVAAMLTLPFLFAAAVQALVRSDLSLLLRAALGYLPLSLLVVSIAAPVTMLLLAASDELASFVSSAAGGAGNHFLNGASGIVGVLTLGARSPFIAFFLGLLTVAGAVALWMELLVREAAVYVIVLMLPLAFAALVWPARRVWAVRAVELLVALILSKFAIVAVLSLAGAALDSAGHSLTGVIAGVVLLAMGVMAPWALLRLVPLAELASTAAGALRQEMRSSSGPARSSATLGEESDRWASKTAAMRRESEQGLGPGSELGDSARDLRRNGEPNRTPAMGAEADGPDLVEPGAPYPAPQPDLGDELDQAAVAGPGSGPRTAAGDGRSGDPGGAGSSTGPAVPGGAVAPNGSAPGGVTPPGGFGLRPPPLDLLRQPDLSHDVLLGPEAGRGEPPVPRPAPNGAGRSGGEPPADENPDPTPPPQPPADGVL